MVIINVLRAAGGVDHVLILGIFMTRMMFLRERKPPVVIPPAAGAKTR